MIIEFDKSFEKSFEKIKNKSLFQKIEKTIIEFENARALAELTSLTHAKNSIFQYFPQHNL